VLGRPNSWLRFCKTRPVSFIKSYFPFFGLLPRVLTTIRSWCVELRECCWTPTCSHNYCLEMCLSWEAKQFQSSQEFPGNLWIPMIHYRLHKCPPTVPILSHLDSVHTPTTYFLMIHLYIFFPSMLGSPKWSLSLRIPHQNTPNVLRVPVISFFFIWSREIYWVRITDH